MLLLGSALASAQTNRTKQVFEREDAYLTEKTKHFFRGAVLVGIDGKIAFEKGYGIANEEWNIPNTPATKFRIGSVTKQFTAACILLLQERGRLRVQDAISKYLEGLPPAWQPITIHQLLTHTSGIPDYTNSGEFGKFQTMDASPQQIISLVTKQPLDFDPGAKWVYSSTNYILLGMIIEKTSGQSYPAFLASNIFEPLGMTNSGYDRAFDIVKERATGYEVDDNSRLGHADDINMSVTYAAGGVYSTVEDLYRWSEALAQDGILLSAASLKQMFTGYAETPKGRHYGYGVFVAQLFGRLEYFHTGAINGFTASVQRYPKERVCIIVLSNMNEFIAWDLGDHIASDLFDQPLP
jgi:D-alanyl-D-alanine carboxypeptidase